MKKVIILVAAASIAAFAFATFNQAKKEDTCCDKAAKVTAQHDAKLANGKEACCKSTAAKPQAKGEGSCCNAKGQTAKFKVWTEAGYKFFGCEGSAAKGRDELIAKGLIVGQVQPVVGKVAI